MRIAVASGDAERVAKRVVKKTVNAYVELYSVDSFNSRYYDSRIYVVFDNIDTEDLTLVELEGIEYYRYSDIKDNIIVCCPHPGGDAEIATMPIIDFLRKTKKIRTES